MDFGMIFMTVLYAGVGIYSFNVIRKSEFSISELLMVGSAFLSVAYVLIKSFI